MAFIVRGFHFVVLPAQQHGYFIIETDAIYQLMAVPIILLLMNAAGFPLPLVRVLILLGYNFMVEFLFGYG
jgi:hypothetical protein